MTASLVIPLLATAVAAAAATSTHRRLPPQLATCVATVGVVVVALAALPTAVVMAIAFLAHTPLGGGGFEWCARVIGLHGSVPVWIGLPLVALLVAGGVRTARLLREHRLMRLDVPQPVHIADSAKAYAVTLPGAAGQVVISSAMIDLLDEPERSVVLAHERAHARYRHDRYLLVAELAAAAFPPLRVLARRITFSIERWADEVAAAECGDRRLVAATLGKVALETNPATVAGFSGLGVAARMRSMLAPAAPPPGRGEILAVGALIAVATALSMYQIHHVEHLYLTLCPH